MQSDALERELGVRKMEGYVDELERVRREDEDRVRQEAERLRGLELERQRLEDERQNVLRRSAIESPARSSSPAAGGIIPNAGNAAQMETSQSGGANALGNIPEGKRPPPATRQQTRPPGEFLRYYGDTRP